MRDGACGERDISARRKAGVGGKGGWGGEGDDMYIIMPIYLSLCFQNTFLLITNKICTFLKPASGMRAKCSVVVVVVIVVVVVSSSSSLSPPPPPS